ncbi:MAG TPA: efflux RND transporter periplasmic adaptor subunit [Kofleriaceae bacterium]|nr:efflux RND transporter periplasmic adaptor subunit [Kofleriaceae bacterium]
MASKRKVALAVALAFAACKHEGPGDDDDTPAAATVTCRAVIAADIDDTIEVSGVVAPPPKVDAIVSSPIAGRVGAVEVEPGDRVAAGALLAVIEDPALPAGSVEAKAAVAAAEAAKTAADQELARADRLVTAGIGARKDLDDARAKAAAAAAELEAANARAGLASSRMARRELRAPRAGTVLHVWRKVGESVDGTTATPVAEIADLSVLELHAQAPPGALAKLVEGMPASAHVLGVDAPVAASVIRVEPAVDPTTLLGTVRLRLDGGAPRVGTAATARIVVAKRPGLIVPGSALRRSLVGGDEVIVCEGNKASVRAVTVGDRGERGVEIKDGLKPGEQVVVDHVLGLEDGQELQRK